MTTEEIKNKLKISENTCIHCPTIKLAIQMSNIFHQLGLRWKSGTHYTLNSNWDSFKENIVYYPFEGVFFSLEFAHCTNYKIINAKEFIALHTEFDLENYIPKGDLIGFPKEIISRMLYCQEEQGNPRDVSVFEKGRAAGQYNKGFTWNETKEGSLFWSKVINTKDFNLFFEKYPKQDNSQEFRVGDKVYDIMCKSSGIITNVSMDKREYPLTVELENGKIINTYAIDGRLNSYFKTPQLLHYRDDYNYDIIDFNNLPERQEPKRWRAKEGETYYRFTSNFEVKGFYDDNDISDNVAYDSGNYFKTKEEAQEVADKLNKYFQELIQTKNNG